MAETQDCETLGSDRLAASAGALGVCRTLSVYRSQGTDPAENLAIEAVLAKGVRPGETIVYLWRNAHTIVIGRNQNAWRECMVDAFEADGGHVVRRRSGGGAVYHDLGNLNVSFVARAGELDEAANIDALVGAVRSFGIDAASTGRNDLTIDGLKFSGTAKWTHEGSSCQHATLMVDVNTEELSRWLSPDKRKLAAKGVSSVRSRVKNLSELVEDLTTEALADAVLASCERVFGVQAQPVAPERVDRPLVEGQRELFASREWRLGASLPFEHRFTGRFAWGGVDIELDVKEGRIAQARVYSDAMDADMAPAVAEVLCGCVYAPEAVARVLEQAGQGLGEPQASCWADVAGLARAELSGEPEPSGGAEAAEANEAE